MDYREFPLSTASIGIAKCVWRIEGRGDAESSIEHEATPDGCVELIRRLSGRSRWGDEQPAYFMVGLNDGPVAFQISGDACFLALRLWPWACPALGIDVRALNGGWSPVQAEPALSIMSMLEHPAEAELALLSALKADANPLRSMGIAILESGSVAEIGDRAGMAPRRLQRWFARNVGISPRRYMRLLRFQNAFEAIGDASRLAEHAATHGYADQAHMAREFREMAGRPASCLKSKTIGPFVR